jgi:hypothetical protein
MPVVFSKPMPKDGLGEFSSNFFFTISSLILSIVTGKEYKASLFHLFLQHLLKQR